jgi:hypothetical protein
VKRIVLIASVVAVLAILGAYILLVPTVVAAGNQCFQQPPATQQQCVTRIFNAHASGNSFAGLLILVGFLASLVGWLVALVRTAQTHRWGWFVAVLLLSPVASLIYGIAGPDRRAVPALTDTYRGPQ